MSKGLKIALVGLVFATGMTISTAEAAGSNRALAREQGPAKADTCKMKWPYVTLTCVA